MAKSLIDAKDLASDLSIEVVVTRYNEMIIRHNIGIWLIKLAAWIMWSDVKIVED